MNVQPRGAKAPQLYRKDMKYIEIDQLREMKFDELREAGFIDYVADRNNSIRAKHAANRRNGLSAQDSIENLSEEYFLSESSIITIVSKTPRSKKCLNPIKK